jgi:hypothetical protein
MTSWRGFCAESLIRTLEFLHSGKICIMPEILVYVLAAAAPMVVGAIWYNPNVFGNAWMKSVPITQEQIEGANMAIIFGVAYLFSLMISVAITGFVIHQSAFDSITFAEMEDGKLPEETRAWLDDAHARFEGVHRSFGHGALHGGFMGILFALPVLGTNALFERKKWKYIFINAGYWIVSLAVMGGIICQFAP